MKITVIGKNSSIFSAIKSNLAETKEILQLTSKQALDINFEAENLAAQHIIVFSGVVSQKIEKLEKIEAYHRALVHRLTRFEVSRVILISSSAVYGCHKKIFSEKDDCKPVLNYGRSKLEIEDIYLDALNEKVSVLRLGNMLGLDTLGKTFLKNKFNNYLDCRPDYSTPLRTYVDPNILTTTLLHYCSAKPNLPQLVNVGRKTPQSMNDAVKELGLKYNLRVSQSTSEDLTLDTSLLFKKIFNYGL